jgi:hypothetical protein
VRDPVLLTRKDLETNSRRLEKLEAALRNEVTQLLETVLTPEV